MPSSPAGRSGSRPRASRMVSANLAGKAVSRTIIGTPGSTRSAATLTPSAVWVSIMVPCISKVCRIVVRRSAWVLLPDWKPNVWMRANSSAERWKAPCFSISSANKRRVRSPSRPSRSNTKRSKLEALEMSIDGLEVSWVSAPLRTL